jgi:DNA-binding HxlR family transcriptional regulator
LVERKRGFQGPQLAYQADPIRESLKLLGRKWTLLIIRDIAFLKLQRFGQILRNNPGLTPRVLSRRLEQMKDEGLVKKTRSEGGEGFRYSLTSKGEDAVYILLAILRFGIRHHMGKKGGGDEETVIKELHYEVPNNGKWFY